mmetsp:Transcript_22073/g.28199  ORF Transcript_22073/g.28199 Transcript_22073/m.28199 type:complete len:626 (+) Transcript_22073:269-2146(+)
MVEETSKLVLHSKNDWPIKGVVVYEDQAEITRVLNYKVKAAGNTELVLKGLPITVQKASVRVEIVTENAKVLEISCEGRHVKTENDNEKEVRRKRITSDLAKLGKETARKSERRNWLNQYAQGLIPKTTENGGILVNDGAKDTSQTSVKKALISPLSLETIDKFLDFYVDQVAELEESEEAIKRKKSELEKELYLMGLSNVGESSQSQDVQDVSVLLDVSEDAEEIEIKLFYLVKGGIKGQSVGWIPSYDIRVEKGPKAIEKAKKVVDLSYYGKVVNDSGEDWTEVALALSTARPSQLGSLPKLPRAEVKFRTSSYSRGGGGKMKKNKKGDLSRNHRGRAYKNFSANAYVPGGMGINEEDEDDMASVASISSDGSYNDEDERGSVVRDTIDGTTKANTQAQSTGGSSIFHIERHATIESDGKPHRQTISSIGLEPTFSYVASPKVTPHVYLKCSTRNTSNYPFLPGKVSVFMNGTFIANSKIELVSPNESFDFFLGIDETVKIIYDPEVVKNETIAGGLTKKTKKTRKVSRGIRIINTNSEHVQCILYEQIPLSQYSDIKVNVLKPDLKKKDKGIIYRQNSFSHLEARTTIKKNEEWKLTFEYSIEWPNDKEIELYETSMLSTGL